MKLGYSLGYWDAQPPRDAGAVVLEAERLGLDSVWTAEAYGSDALTPLAWYGSRTSRIRLGTAVAQLSARTPTAAAMAALTLDHLSGGRFVLGLGASGPQVVEGWYGLPYPRPLARTREYVAVVRQVLAREAPVRFDGEFYRLPLPADEGSGLGRALRSTVHPLRADLPIFLGAEGPKNVTMTAEIADGWLAAFASPRTDDLHRQLLADGFARRDPRLRATAEFEVVATVPVVLSASVQDAADQVRPHLALYVGGMGAREANFHRDVLVRLGYGAACEEIAAHYLAGDRARAVAAVPLEMVTDVALVGTEADIADQLPAWQATAITTLVVQGSPGALATMARLLA
ncbi:LLM class F420-dependent oxidoreductase [Cellulomonas citrea]|uniref:LLM class F420-dependent oxidoreductase n=1 Tax=Cellulomonas citrea TaxID=1909423 RepID=UPI001357B762|nr:LLM class F420-dependent oxidoreductase [Cellulomonas citrea]